MAAVAGYQTINGDAGEKLAPDAPPSVKERLGAVARNAGNAASGARDAVAELFTAPAPAVNVYTEPLNPSMSFSLRDRIRLVWESCREWREFFDWRSFNLPAAAEVKLRYGANFETFFYNYLVIAVVNLFVSAIFHIWEGIKVALLAAVAVFFYIAHPDPIPVGPLTLDDQEKNVILVALAALALFFGGGVFSFLFNAFFFGACVFIVHGFIREHQEVGLTSAI